MEAIAPLTSSAILGSSTSGGGGQQYYQPQMAAGQSVQALVVSAAGDNKFVLDIGVGRILAQADSVTLTPGQSLQLQVTTTSPQLELKIVTAPLQHYLGRTLTFIDQTLNLTSLLQAIQQPPNPAIEILSPTSSQVLANFFTLQQSPLTGKNGGETLRQIIDTIGLQMEAKLGRGIKEDNAGSLKSAILETLHLFENSEQIKESGKTLLSTIESFQLSQVRLEQDKTLILPLPLPWLDQGYLLIDEKQGEEQAEYEQKKQMHFSLHLALTGLGNIQIDFLQADEGLWMRFNCDSADKADFVGQFSDDLKQQLADIPLPLQGLSFTATANPPGNDLIRRLVPSGQSLLDTKV
jgi:hypothetical protein